ncbi:MAG: hypothetical protein ACOCP8_03245 [archaeon]
MSKKEEFEPELIEYIGPAGAGKTTLAKKQIKELRAKGVRVLTFQFYKKHKLILIYDLLRFPFFILKERKQTKTIWNLFKKDIKTTTKIKQTITTMFIIFKTNNLIRRAKKKRIKKVIIDQGLVQKMTGLIFFGFIKKASSKNIKFILNNNNLKIKFITAEENKVVIRRKKRQNKIDKKSSEIILFENKKATKIKKEFVKKNNLKYEFIKN